MECMKRLRMATIAGVGAAYILWLVVNAGRIRTADSGVVQVVLASLFAVFLLLRWKPTDKGEGRAAWVPAAVAGAGFPLFWVGLQFNVHQFEWVGLLMLFYGALAWAMSRSSERDVRLALFVAYWAHPLPGRLEAMLQFGMQWLSVEGAERLLQGLNVRVWADGMVLHSGAATFGVPEACSGLKTAMTVLLCLFGVGLLFRFSWRTIGVFSVLGLLQVLALNILRIVATVWWAPRMPPQWGERFLHDTLGALLLVCIVLAVVEAWLWKVRCDGRALLEGGIREGSFEEPERATILPRFWALTGRWWLRFVVCGALLLAVAALVYRQRPAHRAAMITGVVDNLVETAPAAASRALAEAMALTPDDRGLKSRKMHILVSLGRFEDALRYAETLKPALLPFEMVLKSRSLMALGRGDEAMALLDSMPAGLAETPPVAVLRAEYAALRNEPEKTARMVVIAGRSIREIHRVRSLYAFLAAHEQWRAIATSDMPVNYQRIEEAVLSVKAALRINDLALASRSMRVAAGQWPNDMRLLMQLAELTAKNDGAEWEEMFVASLGANLQKLGADDVARYMDLSAEIGRPDLIWMTYTRLAKLDPGDPAVFLAPAQYGALWFTFRRHRLGIHSSNREALVDLRAFCRMTRSVEPFKSLWERVPLVDALSDEQTSAFRAASLKRALTALEERERGGRLTRRMRLSYPLALAMAGRFADAHMKLDQVEKEDSSLRAYVALLHAVLYDQEDRCPDAYEAVVRFDRLGGGPSLMAEMIRVNALMRMNLGVAALESVRRAKSLFPNVTEVALAEAGIWNFFGAPSMALAILGKIEDKRGLELSVRLLRETGRYAAADPIARGIGMVEDAQPDPARQPLTLERAETAAGRRFPPRLSREEVANEIVRFGRGIAAATSPFVRALGELELEWLRSGGAADPRLPARWRAAGRTPLESMAASHRLAILLARDGHFAAAREVTEEALALAPESPILRRMAVALDERPPSALEAARKACPSDPEIWLAWLVYRVGRERGGGWASDAVSEAAKAGMPPSAIVRAGDLLFRKGDVAGAALAAKEASDRAEGLIAAYALGLKCALARKDAKVALEYARKGIEHAVDPVPFYKVVVMVKSATKATDADMVAALEYLQGRFQKEPIWAEGLGTIYFDRGDTRRSLRVFGQLLGGDMRHMRVRSLLLAAESARVEGETGRSVEVLEAAREMYPGEVSVLNNLVYTLGSSEGGVSRAAEFLPRLLKAGGDRFEVQDTAASIYLRLGRLEDAQRHMEEALKRCDEKSYAAPEVHLNAAEVYLRLGKFEKAREQIGYVMRKADRSAFLGRRASELLRAVKEKEAEGAGR